MAKREISNLDLKVKLLNEYLDNGGIDKIPFTGLLEDLIKVKKRPDGKIDPDSISPRVNAMMRALLGSHYRPPFYRDNYASEYASTLQKDNSFEQINIDTEELFNEIYDEYKSKGNTLFRGQREAKWRLYSSLQRVWINDKLYETEKSYQALIEEIVENGRNNYEGQIVELLENHNIYSANSISVLGYLQHHGCPTPLLDWTFKFQNALYFAIDGIEPNPNTIEIQDYFSVYHIEEKYFKGGDFGSIIEEGLSEIERPMLQSMIEKIAGNNMEKLKIMQTHFEGSKLLDRQKATDIGLVNHMTKIPNLINVPLAYFSDRNTKSGIVFSMNNSENIINQNGVFIWNSHFSKPLELVGDELSKENNGEKDGGYNFCSCFNIHKGLEGHIRKRLQEDGITNDYIYPTKDIDTWHIFEESISKK